MYEHFAHFVGIGNIQYNPTISCGLTSNIFVSDARERGDAFPAAANLTGLPRWETVRTPQTLYPQAWAAVVDTRTMTHLVRASGGDWTCSNRQTDSQFNRP